MPKFKDVTFFSPTFALDDAWKHRRTYGLSMTLTPIHSWFNSRSSRWDLWKHRRSHGEEGTQNVLLHTWSHCVRDLHLVCLVMISETIWSPIIGHGLEIIFYRARPHILWRSPSQNLAMAYAHGKHDPKVVFLWKNGGCSVGDFWTL